jgi:hypothetical protein
MVHCTWAGLRDELEQERARSSEYASQMVVVSAALAKAEEQLPMVNHDLAELKLTLDTERAQVLSLRLNASLT